VALQCQYATLGGRHAYRSGPSPALGERIEGAIHEIVFFYVGMTMIVLFTLGQMKVRDAPDDNGPWWNPFWTMPGGKLAISESGASFVGFSVLMAAALGVLALLRG
jgi:hypothetical protein